MVLGRIGGGGEGVEKNFSTLFSPMSVVPQLVEERRAFKAYSLSFVCLCGFVEKLRHDWDVVFLRESAMCREFKLD